MTIPDFDPAYCIGCGACYHACPAEPRAFVVTGLARHEAAEGIRPTVTPEGGEGAAQRVRPEAGELTDFPFSGTETFAAAAGGGYTVGEDGREERQYANDNKKAGRAFKKNPRGSAFSPRA
jgi:ferredoxin